MLNMFWNSWIGVEKIQAYKNIKQLDYSLFSDYAVRKYSRILKSNIQDELEENISSKGYVVSSLEAVMWLFVNSNDYNNTILKAVNLGDDTDTIGAIVGGLLGIYYGIDNIKSSWKQQLKRFCYIMELCGRFDDLEIWRWGFGDCYCNWDWIIEGWKEYESI